MARQGPGTTAQRQHNNGASVGLEQSCREHSWAVQARTANQPNNNNSRATCRPHDCAHEGLKENRRAGKCHQLPSHAQEQHPNSHQRGRCQPSSVVYQWAVTPRSQGLKLLGHQSPSGNSRCFLELPLLLVLLLLRLRRGRASASAAGVLLPFAADAVADAAVAGDDGVG